MSESLRKRLGEVEAKRSSVRFAADSLKSEGDRNILSDEKRAAGRVFERALNRAGLTASDAAALIANGHTGAVSRLTSGLDVPPIVARWFLAAKLVEGLVEALAELPGDLVSTETSIRIRRRCAR